MPQAARLENTGIVLGDPEGQNVRERNPVRRSALQEREQAVALTRSGVAGVTLHELHNASSLRGSRKKAND